MILKKKKTEILLKEKIEGEQLQHTSDLNKNLDIFSIKLIKVVGVVGTIIGIAILVAFWYWVIKMLYKIN
ncbi:hypothetical protein [Flavobacterium sp.]|uniref:hypothetical protein n=1 Tax=Flavobacterium sp. TaxID=239 RepID=UPI0033422518